MKYPIIYVIARNEVTKQSHKKVLNLLGYEIATLLSEARNDNFIPISRNMIRSVRCTQTT